VTFSAVVVEAKPRTFAAEFAKKRFPLFYQFQKEQILVAPNNTEQVQTHNKQYAN